MKAITIAAAAIRLNVDEREVKTMCKNGYLEIGEIPGELPGVTEESVCEFLGEDYEEKEPVAAQKRRGRQPSVLSSDEAAKLLGKSTDDVVQMAYDDILEEWVLPDSKGFAVTKRSVDAFMKASATKESDESSGETDEAEIAAEKICNEASRPTVPEDANEESEPDVMSHEFAAIVLKISEDEEAQLILDGKLEEWKLLFSKGTGVTKRSVDAFRKLSLAAQELYYNDNFDMSEERELNKDAAKTDVGETFEKMQPVEEIEEEEAAEPVGAQESPIQDLLALSENDKESFDAFIHLIADAVEEETAAIQKALQKVPVLERQTLTITKRDFQAHLNIASMKAELDVYRSLKSFERR